MLFSPGHPTPGVFWRVVYVFARQLHTCQIVCCCCQNPPGPPSPVLPPLSLTVNPMGGRLPPLSRIEGGQNSWTSCPPKKLCLRSASFVFWSIEDRTQDMDLRMVWRFLVVGVGSHGVNVGKVKWRMISSCGMSHLVMVLAGVCVGGGVIGPSSLLDIVGMFCSDWDCRYT
ncbi:hypothetical protein JTE90_004640 [Oedothorax gibbosus]|uniref:Uncharacterized protein n=1 Tax=Oedothorax gibbosus TaxID=931172 RepID=A0AAV6UWK3_9ARAC|nr:hypothetical protein JTE90_004640 [Oedothorax gibbosus]